MRRSNSTGIILFVLITLTAFGWAENVNPTNESQKLEENKSPTNPGEKTDERLWLIPSILSLFNKPSPPPPPPTPPPAIIFINLPPTPEGSGSGSSTSTSTPSSSTNSSTTTSTTPTPTTTTTSSPEITSTPFPTRCTTDRDCIFILNGKYCKPNGICGCRQGIAGERDCDDTTFGPICDPTESTCSCNLNSAQGCQGFYNGQTCVASIFGSVNGTGRIWNGCGCTNNGGCQTSSSFGPNCVDSKCQCDNGQNSECATSGLGRACFYNGCGCQTDAQCDANTFGSNCINYICRCASDTDCIGNNGGTHCDLAEPHSVTFEQCIPVPATV